MVDVKYQPIATGEKHESGAELFRYFMQLEPFICRMRITIITKFITSIRCDRSIVFAA